jgi:hypothetical protein
MTTSRDGEGGDSWHGVFAGTRLASGRATRAIEISTYLSSERDAARTGVGMEPSPDLRFGEQAYELGIERAVLHFVAEDI